MKKWLRAIRDGVSNSGGIIESLEQNGHLKLRVSYPGVRSIMVVLPASPSNSCASGEQFIRKQIRKAYQHQGIALAI
jgi:hypothetical protein